MYVLEKRYSFGFSVNYFNFDHDMCVKLNLQNSGPWDFLSRTIRVPNLTQQGYLCSEV